MGKNPPTICKCGLAKSYHGPNPPNLADHEYEPRYEPIAWLEGYREGLEDAVALQRKADDEKTVDCGCTFDSDLPDVCPRCHHREHGALGCRAQVRRLTTTGSQYMSRGGQVSRRVREGL